MSTSFEMVTATTLSNSTTTTATTTLASTTTTILLSNGSDFDIISSFLNKSQLYTHQVADLMEPERFSVNAVHLLIWTLTILTYLLAIPLALRMFQSRAYLNTIDYFSSQILFCAFIAWIPALILLLHHWFQIFTLRLCRFHYVILSTNETVPLLFVLYMIIERFLYAHPSYKQNCTRFSRMSFIHLYTLFTWLLTMLIYAAASPFYPTDKRSPISILNTKYCAYNYSKLRALATARSIIYFCLFIPALILIGFVLRYFCLMRGTNQVPPIQKLWTIRVTALLCTLVFYDVYLYYLENVAETYKSFLLASLLRASFYLVQLFIIACTEPYWLEMLLERCTCLCCLLTGRRRKPTTPIAIPTETELPSTAPYSSATGHYSLVDEEVDDEFDRATGGPEPTLRVIV